MYAGAPKFSQELFFWSYHLRSVNPTEENILLLNNIDMSNKTAVLEELKRTHKKNKTINIVMCETS